MARRYYVYNDTIWCYRAEPGRLPEDVEIEIRNIAPFLNSATRTELSHFGHSLNSVATQMDAELDFRQYLREPIQPVSLVARLTGQRGPFQLDEVAFYNTIMTGTVTLSDGTTTTTLPNPPPPLVLDESLRNTLEEPYLREQINRDGYNIGNAEMSRSLKKGNNRLSRLWEYYDKLRYSKQTIKEIYSKKGFQKKVTDDFVGIEFENELPRGVLAPHHLHFTVTNDNSLRNNGVEWVLTYPQCIKDVKVHYTELLANIKNSKPNNTERASTHVHFDVSMMNYKQLLIFSCCYFFVEELLSQFAGESRQNNLFCLRLVDSKRTVFDLVQELNEKSPFSSRIFTDSFRYSALNFSAVSKFCSLEFRMFPAVSTPDKLNVWIDALNNLRLFSLKFEEFSLLNKYFIDVPAASVIQDILGKTELDYILKSLKKKELDKEVVNWSRNAYCTVAPILTHPNPFASEEDIKTALLAAEEDEKKCQETWKKSLEMKKKVKPSAYRYPSTENSDYEQLRQGRIDTLTETIALSDE